MLTKDQKQAIQDHLQAMRKKGGEATKEKLKTDPDYYKNIRKLRGKGRKQKVDNFSKAS